MSGLFTPIESMPQMAQPLPNLITIKVFLLQVIALVML